MEQEHIELPAGEQRPPNWGELYLQRGDFQGEDDVISVRMSYQTFSRHVTEHLKRQGVQKPTPRQLTDAARYLAQVACWHTCTDTAVTIKRKIAASNTYGEQDTP